MKHVLTAAALCIAVAGANAQSSGTTASPQQPHNCLTSTTDRDWAGMGLNSEQSTKIRELQADWRKNQGTKGTMEKGTSTGTSPMMDSYEAKVKDILGQEQYDKWVKWCSTHANQSAKPDNTRTNTGTTGTNQGTTGGTNQGSHHNTNRNTITQPNKDVNNTTGQPTSTDQPSAPRDNR